MRHNGLVILCAIAIVGIVICTHNNITDCIAINDNEEH